MTKRYSVDFYRVPLNMSPSLVERGMKLKGDEIMVDYTKLSETYVALGYSEGSFTDALPYKLLPVLKHIKAMAPDEVSDAIEEDRLETILPLDMIPDNDNLKEIYELYVELVDYEVPDFTIEDDWMEGAVDFDEEEIPVVPQPKPVVPQPKPVVPQPKPVVTALDSAKVNPRGQKEVIALCVGTKVLTAKNNKNYINLDLRDGNGKLCAGRKFDYTGTEEDAQGIVGKLLKMDGKWQNYMNKESFLLDTLEIIPETNEFNVEQFMPKGNKSLKEYAGDILKAIEGIQNEDYKKLLHHVFITKEYLKAYGTVPAGTKVHHTDKGGLLQHVSEVVKNVSALATIYDYVEMDVELVIVGALLHDIGKTVEMPTDGSVSYTAKGNMLGHITIGAHLLTKYAIEIGMNDENLYRILHLVATHHGKVEYGSPVAANTPEAVLLNLCDMVSGDMNHIWGKVENLKVGEGSEWSQGKNMIRIT